MENEIYRELTNYFSTILEELCIEKNQETNMIDELVQQQGEIGCIKKCTRWVCSTCHSKLLTIADINQQFDEQPKIIDTTKRPLVIHSHTFRESRSVSEKKIHKLQILVSDLIGINPNSIANVESFITESRQFRIRIRKTQFLNPNAYNCGFQNISGELILSEEMKKFTEIAYTKIKEFIKAKLINKTPLGIWHPIPITCKEAILQ
ncbi:3877_t:CDS:2, partial [Racocetra fulgida]